MGNLKSDLSSLPPLPGWITVGTAARILEVSTTSVYWYINAGKLKHVFRLGEPDLDRFTVVVSLDEIREFKERMANKATPDAAMFEYKTSLNKWNKRVKEWAKQQPGLVDIVHIAGQPNQVSRDAYVAAHPDDPRPVKPVAGK